MHAVAIVAAVLVGIAFVVAGGAKLAAGPAWPAQARDLGAPRPAALFVPWLELVVGAAMIAQVARPWPAAVAIVLLVAFTILIGLRLAEGKRPPCACFGAWSAKPIGPSHIARNAALMMLATLAVFA